MSATGIKPPEPIRAGSGWEPKQLHPLGDKKPAHHLSPQHPVLPERRNLLELKLDPVPKLEIGLELLAAKVAEEAKPEGKEAKLFERLRQVHDKYPQAFAQAYKDLQAEEGKLGGVDFYEHLFRGLKIICLLNPQLQELPPSARVDSLLIKLEAGSPLPPTPEDLARLFQAGELSSRSRALRARTGPFVDACLAIRWNQVEDNSAFIDQLGGRRRLEWFLVAAELVVNLHEKQLERLERSADEEKLKRGTVTKKRAERKAREKQLAKLHEATAALAQEIKSAVKASALIQLGRSVMRARAEQNEKLPLDNFIQNVAFGWDRLGSLAEFLEKLPPLLNSESVARLSLAYRWGRLYGHLAEKLPAEVRTHIITFLSGSPVTYVDKLRTLKPLEDDRSLADVVSGHKLLSSTDKEDALSINEYHSPAVLAAVGRFELSLRAAISGWEIAKLVPAILLRAGVRANVARLPRELPLELKQRVINRIFYKTGPAEIPLLLALHDAATMALPADKQVWRSEIRELIVNYVAYQPLTPESVAEVLHCHEAVRRSALDDNVWSFATRAKQSHSGPLPRILERLVTAWPWSSRETVASLETNRPSLSWAEKLIVEIKRLAVGNHFPFNVRDETIATYRKDLLSLALQVVSVKDLAVSDPSAARSELRKLLADAAAAKIKVTQASSLVGLVYAGLLEKIAGLDEKEQLAILVGEKGPAELGIGLASVSGILAGEIYTALGRDYKETGEARLADEVLLYGLIMRRVEARQTRAAALLSVLRNDQPTWESLLNLVKDKKPEQVIAFIDGLLKEAGETAAGTAFGPLKLIRHPYSPEVLREALSKLTATQLSAAG